jgi:tetratricopeptide (TPR) repeat protein
MIESHELVALLQLARDEECRFVSRLTEDEREATGTLEAPAAKDVLAHIAGAKAAMATALVAAGAGEVADSSHDREALFNANHARPFDEVENDAERFSDTLVAEVERLPAAALASSPAWIDEPTLSDEVVMYGVTHSLTHLFDPLFARGEADDAVRAQRRLLDALPDGANAELRAGALYNLGCLHARLGRDDEAVALLLEATALEPGLADHARDDSDLRSIRARLPA